jgi:DNA-binding NtrC family response regulator
MISGMADADPSTHGGPPPGAPSQRPLTVLLVDDNPAVVDVLSQQISLLEPGWTVRTATDAIRAIDLLEAGHFDVMVSDMRMEEISGLALLRECKERFPAVARIVLSGQINVAHYLRPAQELTRHYLCKPVRMRQLRDTILLAAEEAQMEARPDASADPGPDRKAQAPR